MRDQTLVAQRFDDSSATQLVWLDATGRELGEIGPPGQYDAPSISREGKRIAVQKVDASTGMNDFWIVDLASGNSERVTFESGNEFGPVRSPDGTRIAYASNARGSYDILVRRVDGSSEAVPVVKTDDASVYVTSLLVPAWEHVHPDHPLDLAMERFHLNPGLLPVLDRKETRRVVGVITLDSILGFVRQNPKG